MRQLWKPLAWMAAGLVFAGGCGFLASQALGSSKTDTVTINLATGPRGPAGPPGEKGAAGGACPAGYEAGALVINHPGGQTTLWTCLK